MPGLSEHKGLYSACSWRASRGLRLPENGLRAHRRRPRGQHQQSHQPHGDQRSGCQAECAASQGMAIERARAGCFHGPRDAIPAHSRRLGLQP